MIVGAVNEIMELSFSAFIGHDLEAAYRVEPLIVMPVVALPIIFVLLIYAVFAPVKKETLGEDV